VREGLIRKLELHRLVGLDTPLFIHHMERSVRYSPLTTLVLDSVSAGSVRAVTSLLTIMEVIVQPLRLGRRDVADRYETFVAEYPNLTIARVDRDAVRAASVLRAEYRLGALDALHIAACLRSGATAFLTNDRDLRRVSDLEILQLDDFLGA
jgi:predicted nucleic acid-binding protein